jgi:hypothetical protein
VQLLRLIAAGLLTLGLSTPVLAAYEAADIACETTSTTGTGTINLGGCPSNTER